MEIPSSLVTAAWLKQHIDQPDLVVLDASWFMPGSERNAKEEWQQQAIPRARFFDFDTEIKDHASPLPHMLPSAELFAEQVTQLGITNQSKIVVYDSQGIFSAPRVWWMFRAMGHQHVAVLDGGLPAWVQAGGQLSQGEMPISATVDYRANFQPHWVVDADTVNRQLNNYAVTIVDARPKARFNGEQPEPREGVRSGHMPNAQNLPFAKLVVDGHLAKSEKLEQYFEALSLDKTDIDVQLQEQQYIFTCGSGITACILALAAEQTGRTNLAVYDGSWTESGAETRYPVEC